MTDGEAKTSGPAKKDMEQNEDDSQQSVSEDILDEGDIIGNRFVVVEKLQSGSFGQVFLALDTKRQDAEVALKIEKPRPAGKRSFCAHEVAVLQRCQGQTHIPEIYAFNEEPPLPFIAMQLMSTTLSELRRSCPSKVVARFSLSTTIQIGLQTFVAVRELHGVGVVHRDIKPSNFMLGATERTKGCVYVLDFGLSRFFRKPNGDLITPRIQPGFVGSTRYASPNAHDGRELGRGDDLVSLFYVIVEMRVGRLPWRNIGARSVVGIMKKATKVDHLCRGLPETIIEIGRIVERLKYPEEPNYGRIEALLLSTAEEHRVDLQRPFDWEERFVQVLREDERNMTKQPPPSPNSGMSP